MADKSIEATDFVVVLEVFVIFDGVYLALGKVSLFLIAVRDT